MGKLELAPRRQRSTYSISLTALADFFFFFPRESPSKWVRAARMDTWEHELSRQLPVAGEPDLRLQEGAISSAHSPSDNNPGTAPSSAAPDMVRMLNEWAWETERKEEKRKLQQLKRQTRKKLQLRHATPLPKWKFWPEAV